MNEVRTRAKAKFEVFPSYKNNHPEKKVRPVGLALEYDDNPYYVLKIWMFPKQSYFLVRNHESQTEYMIYSRIIREENEVRFQNPVGYGKLDMDKKSQLRLDFDLLGSPVFMSLFPIQ